jgi:hypothetical protein
LDYVTGFAREYFIMKIRHFKLKGCRFHFSKALLKRIKKMGLLSHYLEHGAIYTILRPFFLLPFVPVDEIIPCFLRCRREMCKFFKRQYLEILQIVPEGMGVRHKLEVYIIFKYLIKS